MVIGDTSSMDDGYSALDERRRYSERLYGPVRRRSMAPRHRRRRTLAAFAVAVVALVLVLVVVLWLSGARAKPHAARHAAVPAARHLGRVASLAGHGAGSFAALERAAENAAITRIMGYTSFVRVAGAEHREIALTFDDGPGPYTPEILRTLEREHVPATFFEVGVLERYFHASTSEIAADGFAIGDHTWAHAPMSRLSRADQRSQLLEDASVMERYGAPFPRLFRPPYGMFNANTLALLHRYKMLMVLWTVDTNDYRKPGVRAIVHAAVNGARPGAIILLHDAGGNRSQTVSALPLIIKALRAKGYKLVTVPKLLLDNPAPAHQTLGALAGSGG